MSSVKDSPRDNNDDVAINTRPVKHPFVILTAKSEPGERIVKVTMPDEHHKMVCGAVTTVGNTIVLGSYPESSTVWTAVHDPARANACVVIKVLALIDENNMYETTVKRLQVGKVNVEDPTGAAWAEANPKHLLQQRIGSKASTLTCPVPAKYALCGGGFYSPMPLISSLPVPTQAYAKALMTKRESDAFGGGGWAVTAPMDDRLVAFAVGLRVRRSAGVSTSITISLDGGCWRGQLPAPHEEVIVHLGGSNVQDPSAAALYLAPSAASKIAISRAPPTVWAQYHTPYRTIEDKEKQMQYTRATI